MSKLPRQQRKTADGVTREIRDSEGRTWILAEVARIERDGTFEVGLVAEDGDLLRRFPHFPDDWHRLPDSTLLQLIQGPNRSERGRTGTEQRENPGGHQPRPG